MGRDFNPQDGQGSNRDQDEGKGPRASDRPEKGERLKKTLMMPSIRPETTGDGAANAEDKTVTAPVEAFSDESVREAGRAKGDSHGPAGMAGAKTTVQPFQVPPSDAPAGGEETTVPDRELPDRVASKAGSDRPEQKTAFRGTDPPGPDGQPDGQQDGRGDRKSPSSEDARAQRTRQRGGLDSGTIMGMPAVFPGQGRDKGDKGKGDRDRGEKDGGDKTGKRSDSGPAVRGDVKALPRTQAIGPAPTVSASERPRVERMTDPEPHAVIDAKGETVSSSSAATPRGADPRDAAYEGTAAGRPGSDRPGAAGRPGDAGRRPVSNRPADDAQADGEGQKHDSGGIDTLRVGRMKITQRMRDGALVVGLLACVGIVALYGGGPPPAEEEEEEPAGVTTQQLTQPGATSPNTQPPAPTVAGPTTQVVTVPPGAEILHSGAVVASTPATLPRPRFASEYLVRKTGYIPQLVRIAPTSPEVIRLELKPAILPGTPGGPDTQEGAPGAPPSAPEPETEPGDQE